MEKTNICRTAIAIALQATKLIGAPHSFSPNTTLNEYFDINPEAHKSQTAIPNLMYYCIGRGGHRVYTDADGEAVFDPVEHSATDTGLYRPVPFVLRPLNNDLTVDERMNYRLRRLEEHDGQHYYAYYLKVLPRPTMDAEIVQETVVDGVATAVPFIFTRDNLFPTPPEISPVGTVVATAQSIRTSVRVEIDFNEWDTNEYYNVCRILKGTSQHALISEIGLVSGVDIDVSADVNGSQVSIREVAGAQLNVIISMPIIVSSANRGFTHAFELGEGEPLLVNGRTPSTRYSDSVKPSVVDGFIPGATAKPITSNP